MIQKKKTERRNSFHNLLLGITSVHASFNYLEYLELCYSVFLDHCLWEINYIVNLTVSFCLSIH